MPGAGIGSRTLDNGHLDPDPELPKKVADSQTLLDRHSKRSFLQSHPEVNGGKSHILLVCGHITLISRHFFLIFTFLGEKMNYISQMERTCCTLYRRKTVLGSFVLYILCTFLFTKLNFLYRNKERMNRNTYLHILNYSIRKGMYWRSFVSFEDIGYCFSIAAAL